MPRSSPAPLRAFFRPSRNVRPRTDVPGTSLSACRDPYSCGPRDRLLQYGGNAGNATATQLASLRAIPNLTLLRPGDANETAVARQIALETKGRPVVLVLARQAVPTLDRSRYASAESVRRGAYVLSDASDGRPQLILIASGSEVGLIVAAAEARRLLHRETVVTLRRLACPPSSFGTSELSAITN